MGRGRLGGGGRGGRGRARRRSNPCIPGRCTACVLLNQFFILLGEYLSVPTETAAPQKTGHSAQVHRQMVAACTWISSHCTEPVSLEEASKVAGFSRCHFSKLFRAYTGLSFTDFVTRERLHIAETLLKKPDLTITEVSLESGFNSISTFNRVF